jgi:lactate 2-monooxygenase
MSFANYQNEIYLRGTAGERPPFTTDLSRLEDAAREAMTPEAFGYVAGSAGSGATAAANRRAFDRWRIVPRMLRDVAERDVSTTVLGVAMPAPVLLAPIGVQTIAHPDGELASARAAAAQGLTFIHSTAAAHSIEDVAAASGEAPRWYQLYWPAEREVAASLVTRAEAAGFGAIVVTLDTFMMGWRPTDLNAAYLPFLEGTGIANYLTDPAFNAPLNEDAPLGDRVFRWAGIFGNPRLTWADLAWLRKQTALTTGGPRSTPGSTASSCPTTGAARSTAPSPPSMRCRRCSTRSAAPCRCWSTRACGPAPTWSRRSASAPRRCSTAGRTSTGWAWAARPASSTCCAACSASWT